MPCLELDYDDSTVDNYDQMARLQAIINGTDEPPDESEY